MPEPYTIRVFVPDGDPEGVKVVELLNWTGVGVAVPRTAWQSARGRPEFRSAGVYILAGPPPEGTDDELPTIYVGQADEIASRIDNHDANKDFWNWAYAFVSSNNSLNRAHITWIEHQLLQRAHNAGRCHLDNGNLPREPRLTEAERADTMGFLREMLRILPLLDVRVFEKPIPVATPGTASTRQPVPGRDRDNRDTVVVPAQEEGFNRVFLGENCWYAIRIGGGMIPKIKYIAAYQTAPVSAITHYAPVERIEPYGDDGKYRLVFSEPAKALDRPIPFGAAPQGLMQGPRYTSLAKLQTASNLTDLMVG
jgi:hypothetical protein